MSDKTYAEVRGAMPFDWNRALDKTVAEPPSVARRLQLEDLAGQWVTCACGNQCAIIPRWFDVPKDEQLVTLGARFYGDICAGWWRQAKHTLALIEARAAILIADELAKLNEAR